mmetsp:Transcript_14036/g.23849  ORF Transcript_14036/g.23849 Transcript_14036/m.23849 type:complete len:161 (-) Transcript_14036:180-662(-)
MDPARYFKTKLTRTEQFSLLFRNSSKNKESALEIQFGKGHKFDCFDIDTLDLDQKPQKADNLSDLLFSKYYQWIWKRDFCYLTKGMELKKGVSSDYLFIGPVSYHEQSARFIMRKPKMIIGTDRMELYEFFTRRATVLNSYNQNMMRVILGATLAHALIV